MPVLAVPHGDHFHYISEDHPLLGHGDEAHPFPLPFVLVFAGYSFILLIDRVMFDSHSLFDHGHDHGKNHSDEEEHKHFSIN